MADDIVLEEESGLEESGDVTPTIYPEEVDITTNSATISHESVIYEVDAGELPASASTTAGVAKSPAGTLYPPYEGAPNPIFKVSAVEIVNPGTGYTVNDELVVDLNKTDAKLKVVSVDAGTPTNTFMVSSVEALTGYMDESTDEFVPSTDPQFAMSGYQANETATLVVHSGDVAPVVTISSVNEAGAVTGLTITEPGVINESTIEQDSFEVYLAVNSGSTDLTYNGAGTNCWLHLTLSRIMMGGGVITEVAIANAGESTTDEVTNPVSVTGGTGLDATFKVTLS